MSILNYLPERPEKPRNNGINMVMDKGIGMNQAHDVINTCGFLIDFMKLGFGTSYVNPNVRDKIKLFKKHVLKSTREGHCLKHLSSEISLMIF
jgi:phosphosulfolactate synthase